MIKFFILIAVIVIIAFMVKTYEPTEPPPRVSLEKQANQIINNFRKKFKHIVNQRNDISEDYAVHTFSKEMPKLIQKINKDNQDWKFERISLTPLNQNFIAKGWQTRVLKDIIARKKKGEKIQHLTYSAIVNGKFRYLKPELLTKSCAACHGSQKSKEIMRALMMQYKKEHIKSYEYGDIIGAYALTLKLKLNPIDVYLLSPHPPSLTR